MDARLGLGTGVLPLRVTWDDLEPDPLLPAGVEAPTLLAEQVGTPAN
ncbi:hypothetical protein [Streptomyces tuirus]